MKSVLLPEDVHKDLVNLKLTEGVSSAAELVHQLIIEHRKRKLLEASEMFRKRADEKGLKLKDILREGKKIKKEVYEEWFESGN